MRKLILFCLVMCLAGLVYPDIIPSGGGGDTTFLDLTDTPSSYSGQSGKVVKVKTDETGLEFMSDSIGTYKQILSCSTSSDTTLNMGDGARITLYDITLSGNAQIETVLYNEGKSPEDGDSLILRVKASGADRLVSLYQGGDGTFKFGSSLVPNDISTTTVNTIDYIGCQWNENRKRWVVVSYMKGY